KRFTSEGAPVFQGEQCFHRVSEQKDKIATAVDSSSSQRHSGPAVAIRDGLSTPENLLSRPANIEKLPYHRYICAAPIPTTGCRYWRSDGRQARSNALPVLAPVDKNLRPDNLAERIALQPAGH